MSRRWGATPEEWAAGKRLAKVDLLPVVSNPHAAISPASKMKALGKTPSIYNHRGEAKGFTEWTDHETTVVNIEAWQKEPDYGMCIQTRRIRGLDIDVPDQELAEQIAVRFAELIEDEDGPALGLRHRADSGKRLLAFICEEPLEKRSFVVKEWQEWDDAKGKEVTKRWIVELLADGQQFVAAGTHPAGARYEWAGGLPKVLPHFSLNRLDRAWSVLVREFGLPESERRAARRDPTLPEDLDVADPVAEHLIESEWPTYSVEKGMLYLDCPWKDGHSSDNGETETAWLLAGTGQYRNGHFACRHAGCANRTEQEFFDAVGYKLVKADQFEDLSEADDLVAAYTAAAPGASPKSKELKAEAKQVVARASLPLPGFNRDAQGRIETSLENITRALQAPQAAECELAFDTFRGELMLAEQPGEWRSLTDADAVELRIRLEALGFKDKIGKEMMRDALELVGSKRQFDSAREWLLNVVPPWDGVSRIAVFWPAYMKTKDSRYTRALGNYSWTAQAGRILDPGCQVDMVPVLTGAEGLRKSSGVALLAPGVEFFAEFSLEAKDEELARKMRGTLVGELAELRGISVRDGEAILAWITRREEKWTPKFKEYAISLARRLVFYGTTNDPEFLQPHMGERRWLPVVIQSMIDTAAIERDRLQLWAEARDVYLLEGIAWQEVEQLGKEERKAFAHVDPWHHRVAAWLDQAVDADESITPRNSGTLRTEDVLSDCLGLDLGKVRKADQMRVGAVLKALGMERDQGWVNGRNTKVWKSIHLGSEVDRKVDRRTREGRS